MLLHSAWMLTLRPAARPRAKPRGRAAYTAVFEARSAASGPAAHRRQLEPAIPGGPQSASALDLDHTTGRGGERTAAEPASLLFSFVSPVTLQDTELNNLAQNQTQRIETARTRATQEERRATPHAADAVFLASGARGHHERRKPAPEDAHDGAQRGSGSESWRTTGQSSDPSQQNVPGSGALSRGDGAKSARSARGILGGRGARASSSARVAHARPNVDPGPAATPAPTLDPKVRDNIDAELLAAALQRSIVDSSTQRAELRAPGAGGSEDPSRPGFGFAGIGRGAHALPYLPGLGDASALDTRDARYVRWFMEQKERVQNELVFPKPRALAKDQGISIYRVVVRRNGQLADTPHLVRSSGYADFDQAAVLAIRRAVPFTPLPERLLPDASDLTLLIPVAFSNPLVQ